MSGGREHQMKGAELWIVEEPALGASQMVLIWALEQSGWGVACMQEAKDKEMGVERGEGRANSVSMRMEKEPLSLVSPWELQKKEWR
jgi:hypothetical protein